MKPRFSLTFTGLLLCSAALPCAASAPMTDFQRFTSYPFMERSYREGKKDNWAEVERLTRHVLGLFHGQPGGRAFRQILSEGAHRPGADWGLVERALQATQTRQAA